MTGRAPSLNLLDPLYAAVSHSAELAALLGDYLGSPSVHTRRPIPDGANFPAVIVGPLVTRTDVDGIDDHRPRVTLDISVYGRQPDQYRDVETLGDLLYSTFHGQPSAISVENYSVTRLTASGPTPAATSDDSLVGRRVGLTVDLFAT